MAQDHVAISIPIPCASKVKFLRSFGVELSDERGGIGEVGVGVMSAKVWEGDGVDTGGEGRAQDLVENTAGKGSSD